MTRVILGIDPGSIRTGFGVIHYHQKKLSPVTHGIIFAKGTDMATRLHTIYEQLCGIIEKFQPTDTAIEQVFMQVNIQSALKLGQARGAALVACAKYALPIHEYSARDIKKTTTGYGAASKEQIQFMMRAQLKITQDLPADAADALAIAMCHAHHT